MSDNRKPRIDGGAQWYPYAAEFKSADGKFAFHIYAISHEHAEILLTELKENAVILGRSISTQEVDE